MKAETKMLSKLRGALEPVLAEELSIELFSALLVIADEPGISVNELADRLCAPQQTASRYASILLGRYQDPTLSKTVKNPLVTQEVHATDPRKRAMFLTERGKGLVALVLSRLNLKEER